MNVQEQVIVARTTQQVVNYFTL